MADILQRFRSSFECQGSAAITADAFSAGFLTPIELQPASAGSSADGSVRLLFEMSVTVAPSSPATCELWSLPQVFGDTPYTGKRNLIATFPNQIDIVSTYYVEATSGIFEAQVVLIKAIDFGFTASLKVMPAYFESV